MLERYFIRPDTVDAIRSSWVGDLVEQYVSWLSERQYSSRSVYRRVPILTRFGEFSKARGATRKEDLPDHVEPFVDHWLGVHRRARNKQRQKKMGQCVRNTIRQMLRIALPGYVGLGRPHKPDNPFHESAPRFLEYLRNERGLRERSIDGYSRYLRQFAAYLEKIRLLDLRHLSAAVLSGFAVAYAERVKRSAVSGACGCLRVFLRYLHRERILTKDLSTSLEHAQAYRLSAIPRSITWDDVRRVLEGVDRRTPIGKRDYAILLLLVTYGLRAREVAALSLRDLDWRNDRLRVPERKAAHSTAFPLSAVVGEAILDYLKNGRPKTQDCHVFFRGPAPRSPIGVAAVSGLASRYIRKAGIQIPRPGSHTLRHTCVQRLVDADVSLKVIGDYVGHRSQGSTQIYSKVDIEALREVAMGDGEEAL